MAFPGAEGTPAAAPTAGRAAVQWASTAVGIVFLVLGVLGFIPGITSNYDALAFAGHDSNAELFGVFRVSLLHNIIHLFFGVLGVALALTYNGARGFLLVSAGVYAALSLYGLVAQRESTSNPLPINTADNWLHLGLAAAMAVLLLAFGRTGPDARVPRH